MCLQGLPPIQFFPFKFFQNSNWYNKFYFFLSNIHCTRTINLCMVWFDINPNCFANWIHFGLIELTETETDYVVRHMRKTNNVNNQKYLQNVYWTITQGTMNWGKKIFFSFGQSLSQDHLIVKFKLALDAPLWGNKFGCFIQYIEHFTKSFG